MRQTFFVKAAARGRVSEGILARLLALGIQAIGVAMAVLAPALFGRLFLRRSPKEGP